MTWEERLGYIKHIEGHYGVSIGHSNSKKTFGYLRNKDLLRALNEDTTKVPLTFKETNNRGQIVHTNNNPLAERQFFKEIGSRLITNETINDSVKKIVRDCLRLDEGFLIEDKAHILNDIGADSLDFIEIIMEVEKEHDIFIPDSIAENLVTVNSLTNYIVVLLGMGENREHGYCKEHPVYIDFPG